MRSAEARLQGIDNVSSSSMRLIVCRKRRRLHDDRVSSPRTFSSTSTNTSMSAKRRTKTFREWKIEVSQQLPRRAGDYCFQKPVSWLVEPSAYSPQRNCAYSRNKGKRRFCISAAPCLVNHGVDKLVYCLNNDNSGESAAASPDYSTAAEELEYTARSGFAPHRACRFGPQPLSRLPDGT